MKLYKDLNWEFIEEVGRFISAKSYITLLRDPMSRRGLPYVNIFISKKDSLIYSIHYFKTKQFNSYSAERSYYPTVEVALFESTMYIKDQLELKNKICFNQALKDYNDWEEKIKNKLD